MLKLTDKPGSVLDSHSSRPVIAYRLKRSTRIQYGPYYMNSYLTFLLVEFTSPQTVTSRAVRFYRTFSPLPDLATQAIGGLLSVALVVSLRSPGVTWHLYPVEPGLSSSLLVLILFRRSTNKATTV